MGGEVKRTSAAPPATGNAHEAKLIQYTLCIHWLHHAASSKQTHAERLYACVHLYRKRQIERKRAGERYGK